MCFNFWKLLVGIFCSFCLLLNVSSLALAGPLSDDTEFVSQVYRDFLNREPDASGLIYWVDQLETGALDSAELVEQYMLSAEFGQTVAPVTRLYFAYFNRIPDFTGLIYWIDSYKQGTSLISISDAFAGSAEFTSTYGSLSNSDFVTLVYQNVLGRDPDQGGLDYWTGLLDSSTHTRGQVMVGFSESDEYQDLRANQIYVTMTYIGLLRRSPDQGGFDYWVGIMDQGATSLGLIDSFLYSSEYQGRFDGTWVISSLAITGPTSIDENSHAIYSASATWADGRTSLVSAAWDDDSAYASIDDTGTLTTVDIESDTLILLDASFSSGGISKSATHPVAMIANLNSAPIANAGQDQNVAIGSLVTLSGSGTDDDGDQLTYRWSFVSAPVGSSASLSDTTVVNPMFPADVDGEYVIELIVNDGQDDSSADSVVITAATINPVGDTVIWGGREWQQSGNANRYKYNYAIAYCNELVLDGKTDWYLPTKDELKSLVVCSNGTPTPLLDYSTVESAFMSCSGESGDTFETPTIDPSFSSISGIYWTATRYQDVAWYVNFSNGLSRWPTMTDRGYFVRCIR